MGAYTLFKGVFFLLLATVGIPSNLLIVASLVRLVCAGHRMVSAEKIISMLAVDCGTMCLTRGLPLSLYVLRLAVYPYSDAGCKVLLYVSRMSRAMAISLTSLLSCLQFLTISPNLARWAPHRQRVEKFLGLIVFFMFLLHTGLYVCLFLYGASPLNATSALYRFHVGYCHVTFPSRDSFLGFGIAVVVRDVFFVVVMAIASVAVLVILYRHRMQMRRSVQVPSQVRMCPNSTRAAKIVVTLCSLYVLFFGVENTLFLYALSGRTVDPLVTDMGLFFSVCYGTIFPVIVLSTNTKIQKGLNCFEKNRINSQENVTTESNL